jgi:short-subunit dehydrogenase
MKNFANCTALITGASAGIGAEIARQLAPSARALVLVARRLDRLEALRGELIKTSPRLIVHCRATDIADAAQLENLVAWLNSGEIKVDLLVNNAGLGDHGDFERSDWKKVQRMIDVNITALTRLTFELLPMLRSAGRATIINVSSIVALLPLPLEGVYAATKAYVSSFTEALRAELRGTGITVTAVCPGPVDTEFFDLAERKGSPHPLVAPAILKVPANEVARQALAAAAKDRPRVIPGRFLAFVMNITSAMPMLVLRLATRPKRP